MPTPTDAETGRVRHPLCGATYNGYRWGAGCPKCRADQRRQFAMLCRRCNNTYFATEPEDPCQSCMSGNTEVRFEPEHRRTR